MSIPSFAIILAYFSFFDTEYDWAKIPPYKGSDPTSPLKSKSPFVTRPIKTSINKGTQGARARYNVAIPPLISIVWPPDHPVISVPAFFCQSFSTSSEFGDCLFCRWPRLVQAMKACNPGCQHRSTDLSRLRLSKCLHSLFLFISLEECSHFGFSRMINSVEKREASNHLLSPLFPTSQSLLFIAFEVSHFDFRGKLTLLRRKRLQQSPVSCLHA